jgi:hypothetical protein
MTLPAGMNYLYSDVPEDQLLREYGRAMATHRRDRREGRRGRVTSRAQALVIAHHAVRHRDA